MTLEELISRARDQVGGLVAERMAATDALTALRGAETLDEATVDAAIAARDAFDPQIAAAEARLAALEDEKLRDDAAAALAERFAPAAPSVSVGAEPEVYVRGGEHSYFRDLWFATNHGDRNATERLARNNKVVARALNTTDGGIGEFVPPTWITSEYEKLARAGRVTADLLRGQALPGGTDSVSLPIVTGGTSTGEQATQGTALSDTDVTSGSTTAAVTTIGGKQSVSVQLVEQSPFNIDDIVLDDLIADHAQKVGAFVISNNAANKRGLLNVSGLNAVTLTTGSPTFPLLWPKIVDAQLRVHTGRQLPATHVIMHPRRWAWLQSQLDSAGRPYVSSDIDFPLLATAGGAVPEGFAGQIRGLSLPVYLDANIPTNLGAGTNEDRIIVCRPQDSILFESSPKAETFRETKAETLQVVFRLYNYVALMSERAPKSVSVIAGTGLVTPTF